MHDGTLDLSYYSIHGCELAPKEASSQRAKSE